LTRIRGLGFEKRTNKNNVAVERRRSHGSVKSSAPAWLFKEALAQLAEGDGAELGAALADLPALYGIWIDAEREKLPLIILTRDFPWVAAVSGRKDSQPTWGNVEDRKSENLNENNVCCGVAVETPQSATPPSIWFDDPGFMRPDTGEQVRRWLRGALDRQLIAIQAERDSAFCVRADGYPTWITRPIDFSFLE
jgi:hypothetical protein